MNRCNRSAYRNASGVTLVELMVALGISAFLILTAVALHSKASEVYRATEAEQALEEVAQLALSTLRHDIELAGFVPYASYGDPVLVNGFSTTPVAVRNDCAPQWAIRLEEAVSGSNNAYRLDCRAYSDSPAAGSDTLTLRSVDPEPAQFEQAGRVYLHARLDGLQQVYVAPDGPPEVAGLHSSRHALRTRTWYVSTRSAGDSPDAAIASLRVKYLGVRNGSAAVIDQEVHSGVEDLQIEFAVDGHFVNPSELTPGANVRAIRVWLLVRSRFRDFTVTTIPAYADRSMRTLHDGYRRKLVGATIAITNDRPL